ncbi:MAG: EamA family transporter [Bacteroidales bacterium]|nr:EamA family transporter [Bacteroidales bacterium]
MPSNKVIYHLLALAGMAKLGNATSTNYVYLNPVFTLITAALILGERMSAMSIAGSAIILAGVIIAGRSSS